jgi:hypothetical protein
MAIVISGPTVGDPAYLQTQIDTLTGEVAVLEATPAAYTKVVGAPAELVQVLHGLPFPPAGVLCIDTQSEIVEPDSITNPSTGITEITFGRGFLFTGTIFLS